MVKFVALNWCLNPLKVHQAIINSVKIIKHAQSRHAVPPHLKVDVLYVDISESVRATQQFHQTEISVQTWGINFSA